MKQKITWKDSFDLNRQPTDYDINYSRGMVTLVNNKTGEKRAFVNQVAAISYIKKLHSIK